ncbi:MULTISPECIES: Mu transposase C-terminal domain-containing protein [unclassified Psychrobacter]|uniref:Mu transposase C-terminal domain-containing protein n=1 Tax=unclassified Psychrobacter TaxID=196806 RepID=UPI003FD27A99
MSVEIKSYYTAKEIADMRLKSLPTFHRNVRTTAEKENWVSRKRSGRGGGLEYAFDSLPADAQAEIKAKAYKALMPKQSTKAQRDIAMIANRSIDTLDSDQRATADARLRMTLLVDQYEVSAGSRTAAIKLVSEMSRDLALPVDESTDYNTVCATALAKTRGKAGVGVRRLHQWCLDAAKCETPTERLLALAPQKQGQPVIKPTRMEWLPDFMAVYRNTNGLSMAEAYRTFELSYGAKHGADAVPHYDAVRRAMDKMPKYVRECGRLTGASMKALKTYVKRDWSTLVNNDVWTGDGHSLKMKVAHPDHGKPFTPELTLIMDTASRYIVGWSMAYSENMLAVGDALRHAMTKHGIPAIYYSDNGSGQKNKTFDTDVIGIFPRLGVHHETGIPGNPQGRGIIERVMKTIAQPIARQFETYHGPNVDSDTHRRISTATTSLANAQAAGREVLTPKQAWAKGKLPSWQQLLDVTEAVIHSYNTEHKHTALGNVTPAAMRQHIFNQMDAEDIIPLTEVEARDMFRPAVSRKVQRAWVTVYNNEYWHQALEAWDGKYVDIFIDQHDAATVIIRDKDGSYICDGVLNGNKRLAFPETLVERTKRQRAETRIKKLDEKKAQAIAETRPAIEHEKAQTLHELMPTTVTPEAKTEYFMFLTDAEDTNNKQAK